MPGVSESEMRRAAMGFVWNVCRFVSWPFGGEGEFFFFGSHVLLDWSRFR